MLVYYCTMVTLSMVTLKYEKEMITNITKKVMFSDTFLSYSFIRDTNKWEK